MVDLTKLQSHAEPTRQAPGHRLARRSIHSVRAELDEQRSLKNQAKRQNIFSRLFASPLLLSEAKRGSARTHVDDHCRLKEPHLRCCSQCPVVIYAFLQRSMVRPDCLGITPEVHSNGYLLLPSVCSLVSSIISISDIS